MRPSSPPSRSVPLNTLATVLHLRAPLCSCSYEMKLLSFFDAMMHRCEMFEGSFPAACRSLPLSTTFHVPAGIFTCLEPRSCRTGSIRPRTRGSLARTEVFTHHEDRSVGHRMKAAGSTTIQRPHSRSQILTHRRKTEPASNIARSTMTFPLLHDLARRVARSTHPAN